MIPKTHTYTSRIVEYGRIIYWYDQSTRCWFCVTNDENGNQIGDCSDAYTKEEILELCKDRDENRKEYGWSICRPI